MMAKAEVVLSAMKALVIFTVLPGSAAAVAEATRHLNRLFEHEGDLGDQRLRQHQRQGGIGASLAHLWNSYLDLLEDPSIPRKGRVDGQVHLWSAPRKKRVRPAP
ncbi:hypothetical protein ACQEU6_07095 [Spirillospora sp. CA-108201]